MLGYGEMGDAIAMDKMNMATEFEKNFEYGKGIIPTPGKWISNFWDYHRNKTAELIRPFLSEAQSILFIGVGSGDVLPIIEMTGKMVVGIDLNKRFLCQSRDCCHPIEGDGSFLPLKDRTFDLVICNMVLHHIVGQGGLEKTLSECGRVLKKNGKLMAFEPNLLHPSGLAMTALNTLHLYHKVAGGSDYEYALSPFRLAKMCRLYFKETTIQAITFSHPRFPLFVQNLFRCADRYLSRAYPFSFSFMLEAVK